MRETYYCCMGLDERWAHLLRASMRELSELMSRPPLEVKYSFSELSGELSKDLEDIAEKQNDIRICFMEMERRLLSALHCTLRPNLSILCPSSHWIAELARKESPEAVWGWSNADVAHPEVKRGWWAATYEVGNKYILWHETLHVLGADDCHQTNQNRGPMCECANCIMQYEPTPENIGEWPFLCRKNVERVRCRLSVQ